MRHSAHILQANAQGFVLPWTASLLDILADDWAILDVETLAKAAGNGG